MSADTLVSRRREVPEIVSIVLNQLTRLRTENEITPQKFTTQLHRLSAEELAPRGLSLSFDELADGRCRFLIQDARGICHAIECNGHCTEVPVEYEEEAAAG